MPKTLEIDFVYPLQTPSITIRINAIATINELEGYYTVGNFCIQGRPERIALPVLEISPLNGIWVHRDSGKETVLSETVGSAIERALVVAGRI